MAVAQAAEELFQNVLAEMSPEDEQYLLQLLAENAPQRVLSARLYKTYSMRAFPWKSAYPNSASAKVPPPKKKLPQKLPLAKEEE